MYKQAVEQAATDQAEVKAALESGITYEAPEAPGESIALTGDHPSDDIFDIAAEVDADDWSGADAGETTSSWTTCSRRTIRCGSKEPMRK